MSPRKESAGQRNSWHTCTDMHAFYSSLLSEFFLLRNLFGLFWNDVIELRCEKKRKKVYIVPWKQASTVLEPALVCKMLGWILCSYQNFSCFLFFLTGKEQHRKLKSQALHALLLWLFILGISITAYRADCTQHCCKRLEKHSRQCCKYIC